MSIPIGQRYFEHYREGDIESCGPAPVTEAEIIDFGRRFDPQPMHVDPVAAAQSRFGGLIASGWHTGSLMMRLYADNILSSVASLASPGVDELRWLEPVRPGDALSLRTTVIESRRSRSKPDRGLVRMRAEVFNQDGRVVMTAILMSIIGSQPAASA